MRTCVRLIMIGLMAMLIAGCATTAPTMDSRLASIQPTEGVVLVKLIGVQRLSAFNAKWQSVKFKNVQTGAITSIQDASSPYASSSLFMGTLPKGKYEIAGFDAAGMGPGTFGILPALIMMAMTSDSAAVNSKTETFTVSPGALNNLGVIVSALPEKKDGPIKTAVIANALGQAAALDDVEPTVLSRLQKMTVSGWDNPPDAATSEKAFALVKAHATNISTLEVANDDRVLIGSALGNIHVRNSNGTWTSMSVGTLDTIIYVRALNNGRIFAASDNGKYFLWTPEKSAWQVHRLAVKGFRIMHLEPMGNSGFAILATSLFTPTISTPPVTKMYFKSDLESDAPPEEALSIEGMSAFGKLAPFYTGDDLQLYFNHIGISRTADLYHFNPVTHAKRVEHVDYWAADMYRIPNGDLILKRMNGMSTYQSVSSDNGKTWKTSDSSGPLATRFLDANTGYGISKISTGWSTITVSLAKTTDGGKTWTPIGTPFESSGAMAIRFVNGKPFVYTGLQLLSTVDEGKTWKTEWPIKD